MRYQSEVPERITIALRSDAKRRAAYSTIKAANILIRHWSKRF